MTFRISSQIVRDWNPAGVRAAVCFTIDDIHPGRSTDCYEAGGDLGNGALGNLLWLQGRHPQLKTTLFVAADWKQKNPYPTRRFLASIPRLREHFFLAPTYPPGAMDLTKHPDFVAFLSSLENTELAMHGLHHCHRGSRISVEFQNESESQIEKSLQKMVDIFRRAGIGATGFTPPGWGCPPALLRVLPRFGLKYLGASRDLLTAVSGEAVTSGSGLKGVSLIHPEILNNGMVHLNSNFSATSDISRAHEIIEAGGVLSIKAHIVKNGMGHIALDGLDEVYCHNLDLLFSALEDRYGDSIAWLSMGELSQAVLATRQAIDHDKNHHQPALI